MSSNKSQEKKKEISKNKKPFGAKKDKVSCVDPKTYSKRFIKYFEKLTDIKHMLKDGQKTDQSNFFVLSDNLVKLVLYISLFKVLL